MLKRLLSTGLIALIVLGIAPATIFAAATAIVSANKNAVIYFNPSAGESAAITYNVTGGTAEELMVRIYKAPSNTWGGVCGTLPQNQVGTILGPTSKNTGGQAIWNGLTASGQPYPAGLYCYRLTWGNPPVGLDGTIDGPIVLLGSGAGNSGGSGGAGSGGSGGSGNSGAGDSGNSGGSGGSGNAGGSGSDSGSGTNLPIISATHNPTTINPYATQGNATYITYKVNENLPGGFSLKIYDSGENVKKTLIDTNSFTYKSFAETKSWDGKDNSGNVVPAGEYVFRFKLKPAGQTVASGLINVSYPTQSNKPDITFYVSPQTFDPTTTPPQSATIYYTVNNQITTGLTFEIRKPDMVTKVKTLYSTNALIPAGSGSKSWDGTDSNGVVPVGYYKVVLISGGQVIASSNVYVQYTVTQPTPTPEPTPPTPPLVVAIPPFNPYIPYPLSPLPFITTHSVSPSPFLPAIGQDTTISYALGKTVSNFKITVKSSAPGYLSRTLLQSNTKTAGPDKITWNGYLYNSNSQLVLAPAGTYMYGFEAAGQNIVTGQVTVATYQQNAPEISNVSVNPNSFNPNPYGLNPNGSTVLNYYLSQAAHVDIVVLNSSNATVRKLVTANYYSSYNRTAGTNPETWNGKDDFGQPLPDGQYTLFVSAHNSNGTAVTKSATVTLSTVASPPPPPPPALLDVSYVSANPSTFNADIQTTNLTFSLNYSANVTVEITRNSDGAFIKTIGPFFSNSGTNLPIAWNGTDQNGFPVAANIYKFKVTATNSSYGSDSDFNYVTLTRNATPPPPPPPPPNYMDVSSVYASPNSFNPSVQATYLTFSLNNPAYVTITVTRASDGTFVKTVASNEYFSSGANLKAWNGTDQNGYIVPNAVYNFRVDAFSSSYGSDYDTGMVTVVSAVTPPPPPPPPAGTLTIVSHSAKPATFNPKAGQTTKIKFNVGFAATSPSSVSVQIYNAAGTFVKTLTPVYNTSSAVGNNYADYNVYTTGTTPAYYPYTYGYSATWDGKDVYAMFVNDGTYTYKVSATSGYQTAQTSGLVSVSSGIYPPPPPYGNCGNFTDVKNNNSLCSAIEFVKSKGIFAGYPDGSLGLNKVIQRAEFLAVVQKAFNFSLIPYDPYYDGDLGYKDLKNKTNEWYMPYVKTFTLLGLIKGYPDGRMKPEQTMNTAELYLVFLRAAKNAPVNNTHFSLLDNIKFPPYNDTPVNDQTKWYLKYAYFAKLNSLITGNYFKPDVGITRGQVIKLVYDTYQKGLITY